MVGFVQGVNREQVTLFPARLEEYVAEDNPVRAVVAFVDGLDLDGLGFIDVQPVAAPCRTSVKNETANKNETAKKFDSTSQATDPAAVIAGRCPEPCQRWGHV